MLSNRTFSFLLPPFAVCHFHFHFQSNSLKILLFCQFGQWATETQNGRQSSHCNCCDILFGEFGCREALVRVSMAQHGGPVGQRRETELSGGTFPSAVSLSCSAGRAGRLACARAERRAPNDAAAERVCGCGEWRGLRAPEEKSAFEMHNDR